MTYLRLRMDGDGHTQVGEGEVPCHRLVHLRLRSSLGGCASAAATLGRLVCPVACMRATSRSHLTSRRLSSLQSALLRPGRRPCSAWLSADSKVARGAPVGAVADGGVAKFKILKLENLIYVILNLYKIKN